MSGHTPGPWVLTLRQEWPFGVVVTGPDAYVVMSQNAEASSTAQKTRADNEAGVGFKQVHKSFCNASEAQQAIATQDANARLIAAAPELREALSELLWHYTRLVNSGDAGNWDPETEPQVIAARAAIAKATQP